MSFGTDTVAGGTTGTLPDVAVATDQIAGAKYQRVKLANPNADQTGAYGIDTDPVRVRPRRRGTADYDSGNVAVSANASPQVVTAATVYVLGAFLVNRTDLVQRVTVTDTAGDEILSGYPLQPRETKDLPLRDEAAMAGLKACALDAAANGDVRLRVWGTQ